MTRFRPYPSYKDSGVEWLGKMPAGWEAKPLKRIGRLRAGSGFPEGEQGLSEGQIPFYKVADMTSEGNGVYMSEPLNTVTADTAARLGATVFPPDAIIFPKVGAALLTNKRRILTRPSCIDNNTMAFVVRHGDVKYYYHWLCSIDMARLANPGAVPSMNESQARDISAPTPPLPEQRTIAAFLDRETQRIDALVEKKEKLVELMQEKRTALISHAVTKGLDPNVRLQDSGVEWLGRIPEHWESLRVGHLILSTNAGEVIDKSYWHDGDELLFTCQKTPVRSWFSPFPDWKRTKIGDVLLTRNGTPYAFLPPADAIYTNVVQRVRLHPRCRPEFAFLVLNQAADTMRGFGDIIESFNMGVWRETWLPLPPAAEQNRIVAFVDRETQRIDAMVEKVRRSIELLKEYRTALISAAVTGKIDVRGAA